MQAARELSARMWPLIGALAALCLDLSVALTTIAFTRPPLPLWTVVPPAVVSLLTFGVALSLWRAAPPSVKRHAPVLLATGLLVGMLCVTNAVISHPVGGVPEHLGADLVLNNHGSREVVASDVWYRELGRWERSFALISAVFAAVASYVLLVINHRFVRSSTRPA